MDLLTGDDLESQGTLFPNVDPIPAAPYSQNSELPRIDTQETLDTTTIWAELDIPATTAPQQMTQEEEEEDPQEKEELVRQVLELQDNLRTLITRVESARAEHDSLQSENQILQKYINNLMTNTAVFSAGGGNSK